MRGIFWESMTLIASLCKRAMICDDDDGRTNEGEIGLVVLSASQHRSRVNNYFIQLRINCFII